MRQAASRADVKSEINKRLGPYGYPFPGYHTNVLYGGPWSEPTGGTLNTTSTRLYYSPFFVHASVTFTRAYTSNQGAGDNGEVYRTGVYTNTTTGGPGTLILEFGEVTLSAAAALRTQTISLNLTPYIGQFVWLAQHHNSAAAMHNMTVPALTTGLTPMHGMFGSLSTSLDSSSSIANFRYVDTAYGALAATAVAPTAGTGVAPVLQLAVV